MTREEVADGRSTDDVVDDRGSQAQLSAEPRDLLSTDLVLGEETGQESKSPDCLKVYTTQHHGFPYDADAAPKAVHRGRTSEDVCVQLKRLEGCTKRTSPNSPEGRGHQPNTGLPEFRNKTAEVVRSDPDIGIRYENDVTPRRLENIG